MGKTEWYKTRRNNDQKDGTDQTLKAGSGGGTNTQTGTGRKSRRKEQVELKTRAVLFVENTKNGELAARIKDNLRRMEHILGYRIKVVERAGTPLKLLFPLGRLDGGTPCGRLGCITCNQEGEN